MVIAQVLNAVYLWLTGNGGRAVSAVEEGLERARSSGVHVWDWALNSQGVYVALSTGELNKAETFLEQAFACLATHRYLDASHYYFLAALIAEQRGDYPSAIGHHRQSLAMADGTPMPQALDQIHLSYPLFRAG